MSVDHAPKRPNVLNDKQKKLAISNSLRYFPEEWHEELALEFSNELDNLGHIYMHRFRPDYEMYARPISEYPCNNKKAACIMLMIQNNLDPAVAQYPHELVTYGGNGSVFQNWIQYRITMHYLSKMNDNQTLVMYSGHPLGLFPSNVNSPRVVITNGLTIPNYSSQNDYEVMNALGVTQYGQMTAGSYMYIGPQGIVHGTTLTILNAARKYLNFDTKDGLGGLLYVTSGLGGMSGAQAKAAVITGAVSVIADSNSHAAVKRYEQGWLSELFYDLDELIIRLRVCLENKEAVSLGYVGNIIDVWEKLNYENIIPDLGSDQTSLHNPWLGGYTPHGMTYDEMKEMISNNPDEFKIKVKNSLIKHVNVINNLSEKGMYFWDYGNAFLLEAGRAGADIYSDKTESGFKYPSYVEDIMGPICFDYGFGPFRWVCSSGNDDDLAITDEIASRVLRSLADEAPSEIKGQYLDNIRWIETANDNGLVVGSKARILYADERGRVEIAQEFNKAISEGRISSPIILGRDHHDVSGTDSPYRETANIRDGSMFTADMSVQNFIGDSFRGATWVSLHNGGGVGWGEVINGGFGMVIDGSDNSDENIKSMLSWDVNNGIARRAWAQNSEAIFTIKRAMENDPNLTVTVPSKVSKSLLERIS
ncbi:MAG: urocanate hydratase [Euryarchaeota archaeon TMED280]|nr:urocanate hydratase [Euryarchaeota archaeon]MDC0555718.1 urocanate hydratase [Euryarchaeota archaeon]OUX46773.1 MAG: urocanate hydratase [Euryarchaeota archaeon TMED280]